MIKTLTLLVLLMGSTNVFSQNMYRNPVSNFNCADPGVFFDSGKTNLFFLTCTGGRFLIRKSNDLVNWSSTGKNLINSQSGIASWAGRDKRWKTPNRSWAPHLTKIDGRYVAYYTQNSQGGFGAIGVSETKDILNQNFQEILNYPLVRNDGAGGVIDPSYFKDKVTGKHYILYKVDGNAKGRMTQIFIREMGPYGSGYNTKVKSVPKVIKFGGNTLNTLVEGQELVKKGNFYYLFYSHGSYLNSYKVKVARSSSIYGPYTGDRVILSEKAGGRYYGPGHGTYTQVRGKDYYFYHAYDRKSSSRGRLAMLDRIYWRNGWPIINNGHPSENYQYKPYSNMIKYPAVQLKWRGKNLKNPMYSLDIKNGNTNYIACVNAGTLRNSNALLFDGSCRQGKINILNTTLFRICAGENGRFSRGTTVCSPYRRFTKAEIFTVIKR